MDDGDACTQVGLADDGLERSAGSSCLLLPTCVLRLYTRVARCSDLEGAARGEAGSTAGHSSHKCSSAFSGGAAVILCRNGWLRV